MNRIILSFVFIVCPVIVKAFTLDATSKIATTDGSESDVQAAVNSASVVDGWTVSIPAGTFTWSSVFTISGKGIKLQGAGSGRVLGRSTTSLTIGTGSKTLTTQSGLPVSAGQTLRVERTGTPVVYGNATGVRTYMVGTVVSYSGTSLTVNITSVGGSGTYDLWIISSLASTTIVNNTYGRPGYGDPFVIVNEDDTASVEVTGVRFVTGTTSTYMITVDPIANGKPVFIHDNYFEVNGIEHVIHFVPNRGIVWNCSFTSFPFSMQGSAIKHKNPSTTDSWTTPSTMGMADTTGTKNLYVEDCDFHAWLNTFDHAGNSRTVVRHCLFNNSGTGSHGADSEEWGIRHVEYYNNEFIFKGYNDGQTFNLNWWFLMRGGTWVVTDNILPRLYSQDYPDKNEFMLAVFQLNENWNPNACWGAGIAGVQYPCPRQPGMGFVTGAGVDGKGRSVDSITYVGDSEPIYIWNNTGSVGYGFGSGAGGCTNPDSASDYIHVGNSVPTVQTAADHTDVVIGAAKPGYTKYTYPHPLRSGITPPVTGTPHPADTNTDYLISLNEATTFGACWKTSCSANATLDNASRAGFLWKGSATGAYQYDSGATCPLCWEVKP